MMFFGSRAEQLNLSYRGALGLGSGDEVHEGELSGMSSSVSGSESSEARSGAHGGG